MNKTITKHILEVNAEDLQKNLCNNFMDILNDYLGESVDDLKTNVAAFHKVLQLIGNYDWRSVFSEGYTMMVLSPDDFDFVDNFFQSKKNGRAYKNDELEIRIMKNGQYISRIDENSIDF